MKIREVNENKKQFISLLLLADEKGNMIDRDVYKRQILYCHWGWMEEKWMKRM